ncbi:MAG: phage holin family protein [Candidatus Falkowbacteria bacterium]
MNLLLKWLIMAVSILLASYFLPGINVDGLWTALVLAVILGLINITLKPILLVVTLPINVLTLGLFTLVINALMVLLATTIVKGFVVDGFFAAMIFSLLLSLINYVLGRLLDPIK